MAARHRILLADDDNGVTEACRRVLSAVGDVDVAPEGRYAMDLITQHCYDVIVSDMVMPGLSGEELLVLAKQRCPETAVILMTGSADNGAAARTGDTAFAYVIKPVDNPTLLGLVKRALARPKQQQEHPMSSTISEGGDRKSVDVGRLRMSVPMIWTMIGTMVMGALAIAGTIWKLQSHAEAKTIHLDESEVVKGGGVAYKADVSQARQDFERRMVEEQRKTRRTIRAIELNCRKGPAGSLACRTSIPDVE